MRSSPHPASPGPGHCPKCGRRLESSRLKRLGSWPLIVGGLVLAIPTIGISLVATIYGVFMRVPACPECDGDS